jgi:hypothetical protein
MKNYILPSLFFLISLQTLAQKSFVGLYSTSKKDIGYESEIFEFQEGNKFKYAVFGCTGNGIGKGNYRIKRDSLFLEFENCVDCPKIKDIQTFSIPSDSLEIELFINENSEGIPLALINVLNTSIGKISDQNGFVNLLLTRKNQTRNLLIEAIGFEDVLIELPTNVSKISGKINMSGDWFYDKPIIKKYKIVSWSKSKLKLKRNEKHNISYNLQDETYIKGISENRGITLFDEK